MRNTKVIGAILGIVLFITLIAGLTYAYATWSSGNINKQVSSKCFDVLYDKGKELSGAIMPSDDYTGGLYSIIRLNTNTECNVTAKGRLHLTTEEATSSNLYREGLLNYQVMRNGTTVIASGNITRSGEIIIDLGLLAQSETAFTRYEIYVWIDNNLVENSDVGSVYYGNISAEAVQADGDYDLPTIAETDISNFTYYLGDENPIVDTFNYYHDETDAYYDIPIGAIELEENEILLTKYNGTLTDVYVPDTYVVNGKTYNVVLASFIYLNLQRIGDVDIGIDTDDGVFSFNKNIERVLLGENIKLVASLHVGAVEVGRADSLFMHCTNLVNVPEIPDSVTNMAGTFSGCTSLVNVPEIPDSVTNMVGTFSGCTSLVNAPDIPDSVTDMSDTFRGCTSLVNAPDIPDSVTDMTYTFSGCTSLVNAPDIPVSVTNMSDTFRGCTSLVNAPVIPSSVTDMSSTFRECTSLVNAPVIPNSVTNMVGTFSGCTNLVNAPVIPDSVTDMRSTFSGCSNLDGEIKINSSNIIDFGEVGYNYVFDNTINPIIVKMPANSTTYNTFMSETIPGNITVVPY